MSTIKYSEEVINLKYLPWVLVVATLNWGLVGLLGLNLVEAVLGAGSMLTKVVYIVIGLVGAYQAYVMAGGKKR